MTLVCSLLILCLTESSGRDVVVIGAGRLTFPGVFFFDDR